MSIGNISSEAKIALYLPEEEGNVLLGLGLANRLKEVYSMHSIIWIGDKRSEALILKSPSVDEFYTWRSIKKESFFHDRKIEVIFFLSRWNSLAKLAKKAKVPHRIAFKESFTDRWLYSQTIKRDDSLPVFEQYLQFTTLFTAQKAQIQTLGLPYPDEYDRLMQFKGTIKKEVINLILMPYTKGVRWIYPFQHYFDLIEKLPRYHFQFFILGTAEEGNMIRKYQSNLFFPPSVTDLTGKLSDEETYDFIAAADGLISSDHTYLQLASELKTTALGVISPQHKNYFLPNEHLHLLYTSKECTCVKPPCKCQQKFPVEELVKNVLDKFEGIAVGSTKP